MEAYRTHGHKAAKINPLLPQKPVAGSVPEIDMLSGTITGQLKTSGKGMEGCRRQASSSVRIMTLTRGVGSIQNKIGRAHV